MRTHLEFKVYCFCHQHTTKVHIYLVICDISHKHKSYWITQNDTAITYLLQRQIRWIALLFSHTKLKI